MKLYHVEVTGSAQHEIEEVQDWIGADSLEAAARWAQELDEALSRLRTMPERCPLAPENVHHGDTIRQLIFGRYRVLFTVQQDWVMILHVRHGARLPVPVG